MCILNLEGYLPMTKPQKFKGIEWTESEMVRGWEIISKLGKKYGWEGHTVQFEILNTMQMLEKYATKGGLPVSYDHWSIGKELIDLEKSYKKNGIGLAYEMIVNTNPSICYMMDTNSMLQQLLCTAHAAVGHAHFFKHNYLFKEWTQPELILDYCLYAKNFINKAREEQNSSSNKDHFMCYDIDWLIDQAIGLAEFSIDFKHKGIPTKATNYQNMHQGYDPLLWDSYDDYINAYRWKDSSLNEDCSSNLLKFVATNACAKITESGKEVCRILSNLEQYYYPNIQTKVMNEGFASFVHYIIMTDMHTLGYIDDGYYLEFIDNHVGVVNNQYITNADSFFNGNSINPYYLGFNIFMDIKRMCENPTEEDKEFSPQFAGTDWNKTINYIVENYKDSSFVEEFLSPKVIRDLKLVELSTDEDKDYFEITQDSSKQSYEKISKMLSKQLSYQSYRPTLTIIKSEGDDPESFITQLIFETYLDNPIKEESLHNLFGLLQSRFLGKNHNVIISQKLKSGEINVIMDADLYWS